MRKSFKNHGTPRRPWVFQGGGGVYIPTCKESLVTNPSPFNATAVIGLVMLSCGKRILDLGTVASAKLDGAMLELRLHGHPQIERFEGADAQGLWSALAGAATPVAELLAVPPPEVLPEALPGTVTGSGILASGQAIAPELGLHQETSPGPSPYTVSPKPEVAVPKTDAAPAPTPSGRTAYGHLINDATMPHDTPSPAIAATSATETIETGLAGTYAEV